jgi:hypothetical protein
MRLHIVAKATLALMLGGLTGCAPSLFTFSTPGYDAQACVEDAITKGTKQELARGAAKEFELACNAGDAASCSALGLLTETGQARERDYKLAARLYDRACSGGNARGCVHLASLELSGKIGDLSADGPKRRLEQACRDGEAAGCEELGLRLALGDGLPQDARRGRALLEKACSNKRPKACYELAILDTPPGAAPNPWSLELLVDSCVAGHEPACRRLDGSKGLKETLHDRAVASSGL